MEELKHVKNGVIEMQYGERFDDTYYRNAVEGVVIEEPYETKGLNDARNCKKNDHLSSRKLE